jgi:hypothetical protein
MVYILSPHDNHSFNDELDTGALQEHTTDTALLNNLHTLFAANNPTFDTLLNTFRDGEFINCLGSEVDMSDALSLDFGTLSSLNYQLGEVAETWADGLVFEGTLADDLAFILSNPVAKYQDTC